MKITKVVGIDIGNYRIKISYIVKGELKDVFVETLPDNIVKDGMVQYIQKMKVTYGNKQGVADRTAVYHVVGDDGYDGVIVEFTLKQ